MPSLTWALSFAAAGLAAAQQHPLGAPDSRAQSHTQGYKFNALLHLPGISPYFDAVGFGLEHQAPLGCNVTAASYLIRHAAIYGNDRDWEAYMEPIFEKINATSSQWTGPLALFQTWQTPLTDPENQLEKITPSGAHDAELVGHHLLHRYPELVPTTKRVYADKKSRTQDTAHAFVKSFPQDVEVIEISQHEEFHANIPHKYCPAFTKAAGDDEIATFIDVYTKATIARLQPFAPVNLTGNDIVGMQQMCGYESAITGRVSDICAVFTPSEWMSYEYAWDLKYSYMVGHGNSLSPYLGFPWLNVTSSLFASLNTAQDDGQRFFVSFTHREVPPFIATALGLFNSSSSEAESFPTTHVNFGRSWKMAELIPFLGHVGIEKLSCDATSGAFSLAEIEAGKGKGENGDRPTKDFMRVLANSAPRPLPSCQDGPGASCKAEDFQKFVAKGMDTYGDFHGVCGKHKKTKAFQWV